MLYYKKVNLNNKNDSLTQIYHFIGAGSTVLDVGCAGGALAKALKQKKNCAVYGLEGNTQNVNLALNSDCFAEINLQDLNQLRDSDYPDYQAKFDHIVCGDVLEHLYEPDIVLAKLTSYLKPAGTMIISLPNVAHASIKANLLMDDFSYTPLGILDRTHLHFYTYRGIARLLADNGLNIVGVSVVTMPEDGYQPSLVAKLPPAVRQFILDDIHSHIMQYVMCCRFVPQRRNRYSANLRAMKNITPITAAEKDFAFLLKRFIITKLAGLCPVLEKLRIRR